MRRPGWITRLLFFATIFCVTFQKVHWESAGGIELSDILTVLFLVAFAGGRIARSDVRFPRTVYAILGLAAALLLVYLCGFFDLGTKQALTQYGKGLVKFFIHFAFLAAAVAYLARRSERFYWKTLGWFFGGLVANCLYGVLQVLVASRGGNLDERVLAPIIGPVKPLNLYGRVEGTPVYRINALAGDPNHLGVMLVIPLLVLTPIYLRLERSHRLRLPLALLIAFLLVIEAATLSRSGLLGLGVGALVLMIPYAKRIFSRAILLPLSVVLGVVLVAIASRPQFFETVLRVRTQTGGSGTANPHFFVYSFVPDVLNTHPLFGLGLNTFSVYYEFVTGQTNWGPHSFYVALIVETGIVGTAVFACFLAFVLWRLVVALRIGKALARAGDAVAARVRPLTWGLVAALLGTMAANFFYLTMQFYYFYAFAALALAVPLVFRRRLVQPALAVPTRGRASP